MTYADQLRFVASALDAHRDDPDELRVLAPMLAIRLEQIAVGVARNELTLDEMVAESMEQADLDARLVVEVPPSPLKRVHLRVVG